MRPSQGREESSILSVRTKLFLYSYIQGYNSAMRENQEIDRELHRVALTAIIHKDDKFLILKRSEQKKVFPGQWTVPGGGLHPDYYTTLPQTYEQQWYLGVENALRHKVREESGLEIGKPTFLLDIILIRPDGIAFVLLSYYAECISGSVKLDVGSVDSAWVTYEQAKGYNLIEGILGELEMADRILFRGEEASKVVFNPEIEKLKKPIKKSSFSYALTRS